MNKGPLSGEYNKNHDAVSNEIPMGGLFPLIMSRGELKWYGCYASDTSNGPGAS
jgi:hypothetical protein